MKSGKLTVVLITIIIMLLLVFGGIFALMYTGMISFNKIEEAKQEENKVEQKEEVREENKETVKEDNKKVMVGKPWVCDAKLKEPKSIVAKSGNYVLCNSNDCYSVPYLNINSLDAKRINNEIEKIYLDSYNKFGTTASDDFLGSTNTDFCHRDYISYEWYINENIVSIILNFTKHYAYLGESGEGGIGGGQGIKYVYNFNIETLKEVTLDEMAKVCGFNSAQEVENKVKAWDENIRKDENKAWTYTGVKDMYFIGENKKLNFIYGWSASGSGDSSKVVEPNKEIEEY